MSDWPPEIVAALPESLDPDLGVRAGGRNVSVDVHPEALRIVDGDEAYTIGEDSNTVMQLSRSVTPERFGWLRGLLGLPSQAAYLVLELRHPGMPDLVMRAEVPATNQTLLASLPRFEPTDAPALELESLLELLGWAHRLGIRPAHVGAGDAVASEPPTPDIDPSERPSWRERLDPHREVVCAVTAIPAALLAPFRLGDAGLGMGSAPPIVGLVLAALVLGAVRAGVMRAAGPRRVGGVWAVVATVSAATMLFTSVPLTPGLIAFALCVFAAVHGALVGLTWGVVEEGSLGGMAYGGGVGLAAGVAAGCALAVLTQWVGWLFDPGPTLAVAALTCVAVASTFVGVQMRALRI